MSTTTTPASLQAAELSRTAPAPRTETSQPAAPYRVGISGSYGGLNLGDEAILQAIVAQLRAGGAMGVTVFSRAAKGTMARPRGERARPGAEASQGEVLPE